MALNSSDVSAGDDILASHHNLLIDDIEQHTHDGTDTSAVTQLDTTVAYESAITRYISISAYAAIESSQASLIFLGASAVEPGAVAARVLYVPVTLPHGSIVTSLKIKWVNQDASATATGTLYRAAPAVSQSMAVANSTPNGGRHTVEDTTISYATVNNDSYIYYLYLVLTPNAAITDTIFEGAVITYTITTPAP